MKMTKILALVMGIFMMITVFAGCDLEQVTDVIQQEIADTPIINNTIQIKENNHISLPDGLTAKKIGSLDVDYLYSTSTAGLVYRDDNDKFGIMSLDGKSDTGAKYTLCDPIGEYFVVMTTYVESAEDMDALNSAGVVDVTGKEIVPMKYASVEQLNERYLRVCEVTERTTDKDAAMVYFSNNMFSLSADDDDILYLGNWYIYDTVAGKILDGVTGTKPYRQSAYGNFVSYVTDDEQKITINEKGEQMPEDADLFENGCYALESGKTGAVFNSDHKKLFAYDPNGFVPEDSEGEYLVACKFANGEFTYVLMDQKGNIVSAEFAEYPLVYGALIQCDDQIYNFAGELVIEGTYSSVYQEEQIGCAWFLRNDDQYVAIQADGTILYQGVEDEDTYIDAYTDYAIIKDIDGEEMAYCYADQDFTLKGDSFGPWLIETENDDGEDAIADSISGTILIEGYYDYDYVAISGSVIYVYAEKDDGGIDIYMIK